MAGVYIHIPFCRKFCNYCDFYHVTAGNENTQFINALIREIEFRKDYLGKESVSTIYLGGGTPSVLTPEETARILKSVSDNFIIETDNEITIEINPDDVSAGYLKELIKLGINRISIGVQSWRDEDLRFLHRRHDARQAGDAIRHSFDSGFTNVTIDLIYGIPGLTGEAWSANLDKSFASGITHLSAYHLTIEPGTRFGKDKELGLITEIDEEESSLQFNILNEKAAAAGFIHYEISNFGKPGFFSRHNTNYWKQVPYLGIGPSAHSFNRYSRQWNIPDVKKYIKNAGTEKQAFETEELSFKMMFNEYIMTSLRTMWGIDLEYVERTFEKEGYDYIMNMASKFINYGLMRLEKNTLVLTDQGMMISDNIISEMMMPGERN